jgi:hypothetical protein
MQYMRVFLKNQEMQWNTEIAGLKRLPGVPQNSFIIKWIAAELWRTVER